MVCRRISLRRGTFEYILHFLLANIVIDGQVKAFIEHFHADLHQREEQTSITRQGGVEPKVVRHKPFNAVEVVITDIDLRALFAVFAEPQKKTIPLKGSLPGSTKFWEFLVPTPSSSLWVDTDDFVELDWSPNDREPNLYLHDAAHCPRFVYFKRSTRPLSPEDINGVCLKTKFGDENSHVCLMGKQPSGYVIRLKVVPLTLPAQLPTKSNLSSALFD